MGRTFWGALSHDDAAGEKSLRLFYVLKEEELLGA